MSTVHTQRVGQERTTVPPFFLHGNKYLGLIMEYQFHIWMHSKSHGKPDHALLIHIVILFGRYPHQRHHQHGNTHESTRHKAATHAHALQPSQGSL
jgi:hypothetical protein